MTMLAMRARGFHALFVVLVACGGNASTARPSSHPPVARPAPEDRYDFAAPPPLAPALVRVHLIDVGQGAATLFELSCGAILVDTGGEEDRLYHSGTSLHAYLEDFFRHRPDLNRTLAGLFITHPHVDHARNVKDVATSYTVENVVTDGRTSGSGGSEQAWLQTWATAHAKFFPVSSEEVPAGGLTNGTIDPLACADVDPKITVLWGAVPSRPPHWSAKTWDDENNHSVVVRVDVGKASFLVSGDLEVEGAHALIEKHRGTSALDVDVWEVSHHGSYNGTSPELVSALSPEIALLAVGPVERELSWTAWDYGHPRKVTIEMLEGSIRRTRRPVRMDVATAARGAFEPHDLTKAIYGTGWDGSVVITATTEGRYRVQTER